MSVGLEGRSRNVLRTIGMRRGSSISGRELQGSQQQRPSRDALDCCDVKTHGILPRVADCVPLYVDRRRAAEAILTRYRDATVPMVADRRNRIPDPHGNGVLVTARGSLFLLTAAHVLDSLAGEEIDLAHPSAITRLRGAVAKHRDLDIAIVRMDPGSVNAGLVEGALTIWDFGHWPQGADSWLTLLGYPPKRIKQATGVSLQATAQSWIGQNGDPSGYAECGLDPARSIAMRFDTNNALNDEGERHRTIGLRGMSGAGMWIMPPAGATESDRPGMLAGIFTEQKRGHLIGVPMAAFLAAMRYAWPGIFWLRE